MVSSTFSAFMIFTLLLPNSVQTETKRLEIYIKVESTSLSEPNYAETEPNISHQSLNPNCSESPLDLSPPRPTHSHLNPDSFQQPSEPRQARL